MDATRLSSWRSVCRVMGLASEFCAGENACSTQTPQLAVGSMSSQVLLLSLQNLQRQYQSGAARPEDIVRLIYERINAAGDDHVWIYLVPEEAALQRARELGAWSPDRPLFGIPFAVKDNIDVEGLPDYRGMSGLLLRAAANCKRRSEGARCRCDPDRQDEHGSVCNRSGGNSFALWRVLQYLPCRLHFGRLQFRLSGSGRERRSLFRSGYGHRGIGPRTGGL